MLYFSADHHFFHANIVAFCHRPFYKTEDMNAKLIENWNEVVGEDDIIYHLGDFSFGNGKQNKELGAMLNGHKFLCIGSHDKQRPSGVFEDIKESYMIHFKNDMNVDQHIFMNHYLHKTWPLSHYGSWHLYGHSHGGMNEYAKGEGKLLDVGCDSHDFKPWSLDEIREVMATRPLNFNDLQRRKQARIDELTKR